MVCDAFYFFYLIFFFFRGHTDKEDNTEDKVDGLQKQMVSQMWETPIAVYWSLIALLQLHCIFPNILL